MTESSRESIQQRSLVYAAIPLIVLLATLIRLALQPVLGSSLPFVFYFTAILYVAWKFGLGPATLAIVLSAIAGCYYFAEGIGHFLPQTQVGQITTIGFVVTSFSVSFLLDLQRRTLRRAREAENEQRRANEELARVNRDLEAFAYSASHDLREPLRTISLASDLLEHQLAVDRTVSLAFIRDAARRMTLQLDGLLEYATAGHLERDALPNVDSNRVLADVLASLSVTISDAGATVLSGGLPRVAVAEAHLTLVLQNLLSNAVNYGGKVIRVSAEAEGRFVIFSIADDGIGIDPQYGEQVFGLFKRLDRTRHPDGSGLGLAICRRVVERYGGRIWLSQSKPGEGATFRFSVPRAGTG